MKGVKLGKYRHFKGNEYELIAIARDSEDSERLMAVYRSLKDSGEVWVRPLSMWQETVKLPDGRLVPRFSPID